MERLEDIKNGISQFVWTVLEDSKKEKTLRKNSDSQIWNKYWYMLTV